MACVDKFSKTVYMYYEKSTDDKSLTEKHVVSINKDLFIPYLFEKDEKKAEKLLDQIAIKILQENITDKNTNETPFGIANTEEAKQAVKDFIEKKLKNLLLLRATFSNAQFTEYEKLFAIAHIRFLMGGNLQNDLFSDKEKVKAMIVDFLNSLDAKEIGVLKEQFVKDLKKNKINDVADILSYSFMFNKKEVDNKTVYEKTYSNYRDLVISLSKFAQAEKTKQTSSKEFYPITDLLEAIAKKASLEFLNGLDAKILNSISTKQKVVNYNQKYQYLQEAYSVLVSNALLENKDNTWTEREWEEYGNQAIVNLIEKYTGNMPQDEQAKVLDKISNNIIERLNKQEDVPISFVGEKENKIKKITFIRNGTKQEANSTQEFNTQNIDLTKETLKEITNEVIAPIVKQASDLLGAISNELSNINQTLERIANSMASSGAQQLGDANANQNNILQELLALIGKISDNVSKGITNGVAVDQSEAVDKLTKELETLNQELEKNATIGEETTSVTEELKNSTKRLQEAHSSYKQMFAPIIVTENDSNLTLTEDKKHYEYKGLTYQRYTDVIEKNFHFDHEGPIRYLEYLIHRIKNDLGSQDSFIQSYLEKIVPLEGLPQSKDKSEEEKLNEKAFLESKANALFILLSSDSNKELINSLKQKILQEYFDALEEKRNFDFDNVYKKSGNKNGTFEEQILKQIKSIVKTENLSEEIRDKYTEIINNVVKETIRKRVRDYEYYTQRATIGRLTEKAIQNITKAKFEAERTGQKVEAYSILDDSTLTNDEFDALIFSYDTGARFKLMNNTLRQIYKNENFDPNASPRDKFNKIKEIIGKKIEEIDAEIAKRENAKGKLSTKKVTGETIDTAQTETEIETLEKQKEQLNTYLNELENAIERLNKQYDNFAEALYKETKATLEEWKQANEEKTWEEILLFNTKILGNVAYSDKEMARLAGTPDVLILRPDNKYKIYEIKTYLNKSIQNKLNSINTAKTYGYSLADKAMYQVAGYVSLLQASVAYKGVSDNIEANVVFFGNAEKDKEGNRVYDEKFVLKNANLYINEEYTLFQQKILSRGVDSLVPLDRHNGTSLSDEHPLFEKGSVMCNIALANNHEKKENGYAANFDLFEIRKQLADNQGRLILEEGNLTDKEEKEITSLLSKTNYEFGSKNNLNPVRLYFENKKDKTRILLGVIDASEIAKLDKIKSAIQNENYDILEIGYDGVRLFMKENKDKNDPTQNQSMKIQDFMETFLESVSTYYGIDKEKLEIQTEEGALLGLDTGLAKIDKNQNELIVVYKNEDGQSIVLARQRIYKPRIETKSESAKTILEQIQILKKLAEKYRLKKEKQKQQVETNIPFLFYEIQKSKSKDADADLNQLKHAVNTLKQFVLNNLQPLSEIGKENATEKNKLAGIKTLGISLRYLKDDYLLNIENIENNTGLKIIEDELSGKNKTITPFYEHENWFTIRRESEDGPPKIFYNDNGLVRIGEFERDKKGRFTIIPKQIRLAVDEKKKQLIDKEERLKQKRDYVIKKANTLLSKFVIRENGEVKKVNAIYKDPSNIASQIDVRVPEYVMGVMEEVRKKHSLSEENFVVFQNNIAELIYALEGIVYETRFGFTQEDGFINRPSDIKNFDIIFKLVVHDIIGQIDTWALQEFLNDPDALIKAKQDLNILKETLNEILKAREGKRIAIKNETIKTTTEQQQDTQEGEQATASQETDNLSKIIEEEQVVDAEEEEVSEEDKETKEVISTQQSIILGASSMTLEKNVNSVIKNIIRYTAIKGEYELANGIKIQTNDLEGQYINFDVIYNSLPNFANKRYYAPNSYYNKPANTPEEISENILSYLMENRDNAKDDFYIMLLAVYDKMFSKTNPNSLLNKAKNNKELEYLSNGLHNALGSFVKTRYLFSDAKSEFIGIRNLVSYSQKDASEIRKLMNNNDAKSEANNANIKTKEDAVNFIIQKTGIAKARAVRIFYLMNQIVKNENEINKRSNQDTSPKNILLLFFESKYNEKVTDTLTSVSEISESSAFKTLEGETRSDMGLRSTTIEDLQLLQNISKEKQAKRKMDDETKEEIKKVKNAPHFKHNDIVQNGITEYGDYLGVQTKKGVIPYAKMDIEDILYRFYLNIFKPLKETMEKNNASPQIYINSFVSSNKKISFQVSLPHGISTNEINQYNGNLDTLFANDNALYNSKIKDMLFKRFMSELKAREVISKTNSKIQKTGEITFEFLSYVNKDNQKISLKFDVIEENGELNFSESQEEIDNKIREHFKELMKVQIEKANGLISNTKYDTLKTMLDNESLFALSIALHRAYKWDLDTYLYGFANMEYGSIDKANKRASIHTSVKYKLNASEAFGVGKNFPVAMLKTPDKAMPEMQMLGYAKEASETEYKPFDGSAFVNPVFAELFARATGKNLGFGLTQEGSHKPVAMWRDRTELKNVSLKFATFDMLLGQIDTEAFFETKKLMYVMLSKKVVEKDTFYDGLTIAEKEVLEKVKNGEPVIDEVLKKIPFSKLNISRIADNYQAVNYYNASMSKEKDMTPDKIVNPYNVEDERHEILNLLIKNGIRENIKTYTLFSDIIGIAADKEAFKNHTPRALNFYEANTNKSIGAENIVVQPENIIHYPTKYFGYQLNPHHEIEKTTQTPLATQLLYLISLYSSKNNTSASNKERANEIYQLLQGYIKSVNVLDIIPYLKQDEEGNIIIDHKVFYEKVYANSNSDKGEMDLFLELVANGKNPFIVPSIANKLVANVSSIIEKNIVRLKTLGTDYVLVPDFYVTKTTKIDKGKVIREKLQWHNLVYEAKKDINLAGLKVKKGGRINYSNLTEAQKQAFANANKEDFSLVEVKECDLAMPILDKGLFKQFIGVANIINQTIKERKLTISELPEFDTYGKDNGFDNPYLFLELVKQKIEVLEKNQDITKDGKIVINEKRSYDINNLKEIIERFERMISPLGVRIPTTSKGNAVAGRVVKFLDTESNIVIFPSEIVKIHGSDYDVDKIKLFFKNYLNPSIIKESHKEQYEMTDKMIDTIKQILLDKENVYEFFTDIDFANAKNNIEIYSDALRTELVSKTIPYATLEGDAKLQTENMTNVFLVGIFATVAKFFAYASLADLKIKSGNQYFSFNLDLPEREQFIYRVDEKTKKLVKIPTDNNATYTKYVYSINAISIATNAAIDAVKEQIHGAIGNDLYNARLYAFLLTQRNAFTTSSFFLSPFVHYNIIYGLNEKKKKLFDAIFRDYVKEEKPKKNDAFLMIEGTHVEQEKNKTSHETGVISDESLYNLLKEGPNKNDIDNFFASIEFITKHINDEKKKESENENVKESETLKTIQTGIKKIIEYEKKQHESNRAQIASEKEAERILKMKQYFALLTGKPAPESINDIDPTLLSHIQNIERFASMITKKIQLTYVKKDGSISNDVVGKEISILEASASLLAEYEVMLKTINKQLAKASSVFGINQGYQKDIEENMERFEKAVALMENKEEAFLGMEKLFADNNAGFFFSYYSKLMEGLKLIDKFTFLSTENYKNGYTEYLKYADFGQDKKVIPLNYRRAFARVLNKIMILPNGKFKFKNKEYDFSNKDSVNNFINNFTEEFSKRNVDNIFHKPLLSISVQSDKKRLYLSFSNYNSNLGTQKVIYGIFEKIKRHEANKENEHKTFFESLDKSELVYIKTAFNYTDNVNETEAEETKERQIDNWQIKTFKELIKQHKEALETYYALYLYDSLTNPNKGHMSVLNTLPNSIMVEIYGKMAEKMKNNFKEWNEDEKTIFLRETFLNLKTKSLYDFESVENQEFSKQTIDVAGGTITVLSPTNAKQQYPYAFELKSIDMTGYVEKETYIKLTNSEIANLGLQREDDKGNKYSYYIKVNKNKNKKQQDEEEVSDYKYSYAVDIKSNAQEGQSEKQEEKALNIAHAHDTFNQLSISDEITYIFEKVKNCK